MEWHNAVEHIKPLVFRLDTPTQVGTAFLYNTTKDGLHILCTARHVVEDLLKKPGKISLANWEGKTLLSLFPRQYIIYPSSDALGDTAIIIFFVCLQEVPNRRLHPFPASQTLKIGWRLAWVGYPALWPMYSDRGRLRDTTDRLCFFSGHVSSHGRGPGTYLIDGLGVKGVSGGPVFCCDPVWGVSLIGTVNEVLRVRANRGLLPALIVSYNLVVAEDVFHFLNSVDGGLVRGKTESDLIKTIRRALEKQWPIVGPLSHLRVSAKG